MAHRSLAEFVAFLRQCKIVPRPQGEEWKAMIARIHVTGAIAEIDAETYDWFLECLPPKYQNGGLFAFAEGAEVLKIFWPREGKYFVRPLTWDETQEFCRLARIAAPW
jgi:hypothetical protein